MQTLRSNVRRHLLKLLYTNTLIEQLNILYRKTQVLYINNDIVLYINNDIEVNICNLMGTIILTQTHVTLEVFCRKPKVGQHVHSNATFENERPAPSGLSYSNNIDKNWSVYFF